MREEIKRKLFHSLALGYVAGVFLLPRPLFIGVLIGLLFLDILFEVSRLKIPAFADFCQRWVGGLVRKEENTKLTAVFWMLLGVISSALIIKPALVVATVYLFLIFGDGAASLAGKGLGGPQWPGSPKRISGTAACFFVCVALGFLILSPAYSSAGILAAAAAATFFEFGFFSINDNLMIPLGTSLAFKWIYNLGWGLS